MTPMPTFLERMEKNLAERFREDRHFESLDEERTYVYYEIGEESLKDFLRTQLRLFADELLGSGGCEVAEDADYHLGFNDCRSRLAERVEEMLDGKAA